MLNLTDNAKRFLSIHQEHAQKFDESCLSQVTRRQLESVTALFNVGYDSRCSFQEKRYRVSFFTSREGESIKEFLGRKAFISGGTSFVPHICTDETHEPNGLVLMPDGGLAVFCDSDKQMVIYSSVEKVLERDAYLNVRAAEYVGTISFRPHVDQRKLLRHLSVFEAFEPASDEQNALVQSKDSLCLLQWWHNLYAPNFINAERACTMRVFSSQNDTFNQIQDLFNQEDLVCSVPSNHALGPKGCT